MYCRYRLFAARRPCFLETCYRGSGSPEEALLKFTIPTHQLRHTFATEMLRLGVSLPALMQLPGHKASPLQALRSRQRIQPARTVPRQAPPTELSPRPRLTDWFGSPRT